MLSIKGTVSSGYLGSFIIERSNTSRVRSPKKMNDVGGADLSR